MTKVQFQKWVEYAVNIGLSGEAIADTILANHARPFDPQLAAMMQSLAASKLAIRAHLEKKFER